ncbi:Hypothetical protein NGAL_HAMBI1146_54870 [Neorhizobium galegae bv. officinalis]|nr:Hypothetical protein NGAL_HAMBI490_57600 [Neorhizobium galegae bv. officinalis]CDZ42720.1 Hypothetical protein NGAL_HAMBI1146_54870 [Neorhizobium galegae bv. officinalis]
MILDLHRQGLTVSAISRETGIDRKTVRKYIERGLEAPAYGPRMPRATVIDPFAPYLRERVKSYPGLTGSRLFRELRERGYTGSYTAVTDFLRDVRPPASNGFEVRFETPPGDCFPFHPQEDEARRNSGATPSQYRRKVGSVRVGRKFPLADAVQSKRLTVDLVSCFDLRRERRPADVFAHAARLSQAKNALHNAMQVLSARSA